MIRPSLALAGLPAAARFGARHASLRYFRFHDYRLILKNSPKRERLSRQPMTKSAAARRNSADTPPHLLLLALYVIRL